MIWTVHALNPVVQDELDRLPDDLLARFLKVAEMLEENGPQKVGMPYVRPLGGKLWEMRFSGKTGIGRAIYTATSGQRLVVLHAFIKKSRKTPDRALALARARLREVAE